LRLEEQENATVVPAQAVQNGQAGDYVFVVTSESTAEQRQVKVARTIEGDAVISKGIEPGETIVTDGQLRLIPGIKVQVRGASARSAGS
jgi:multidrug efflux system membrane fusion protein